MSQSNKREPSDGDGDGDGGGEAKRLKSSLNVVAEEFVCPITMELPLKAVIAKDGITYEESAIKEHIERQGDNLKSPVTNAPMGPELVRATAVRNAIEKLVKSGVLDGDKARNWEKRIKDEKKVASLKGKAAEGDSEAMFLLGNVFDEGLCGEKKDMAKAFSWYKQAADNKYPPGMAAAGDRLVLGWGTPKNVAGGMILVTSAAERGSAFAASCLGAWYAEGCHTVPKDTDRAKEWLQKAISGSGNFAHDLLEDDKNDARNLLNNELVGGESE